MEKQKKLVIIVTFIVMIGIAISITSSYVLAESIVDSKNVYYKDNSGLAVNNVQDAIDGTCKRFEEKIDTFLDKVYPVGSIYISYNNTNPASFFGGEWVVYGDGRVLKGISSGEAGKTGGSNSVTLKEDNLPAHTHNINHTHTTAETNTTTMSLTAQAEGSAHQHKLSYHSSSSTPGGNAFRLVAETIGDWAVTGISGEHTHNVTGSVTIPSLSTNSISTAVSGSTGNDKSFSVENAYITVYMWRRTA